MVGPWMLCGNGWSLWERYHGWYMDGSVGTDGVCGNVTDSASVQKPKMLRARANCNPDKPNLLENARHEAPVQARQERLGGGLNPRPEKPKPYKLNSTPYKPNSTPQRLSSAP